MTTDVNYHEVTNGDNMKCYIQTHDIDHVTVRDALTSAGSSLVPSGATAPRRSYCFRQMSEREFETVLAKGGMSELKKANKGEKWFTESLDHTRQYHNRGVTGPEVVAEFRMDREGYAAIRKDTMPQKGSKALQPKTGIKKNIFTRENLKDHPRGKVNIGLKGNANVKVFNKSVISVTKVNPNSVMNKYRALQWLRRNKLRAGMAVVGVVLDGISLTLSIIEDGGKFGPSTTVTVAEMTGGSLGALITGAVCSLIPFIGSTIGAFIGGLIGSLIARGITKFFVGHSSVGPGAPLLDTDPYTTAFGARPMEQVPQPYNTSQDTPAGAFGFPDMGFDVDQGFPGVE